MDSSMTPERWAKISEVLERALQLSSEERAGFLERVCSSDPQLRREVESILSANVQTPSGFLQSPPVPAELTQGSRLGDYEIQSLLGAGGMGVVYRARDLHLRRDVAIKVLPPFASIDPERLRRFEQEALAAAALNHPNVLAIYQFGEHQGSPYLVSELLEGETLRDRLNRGPLPLANAIDYGIQIARGLAAAHEKGIVHRDLKPENLFVTRDGLVKILDFGLAKLVASRHSSGNSALTRDDETEPGKVMGTVGYMAPEQVRGKPSDDRADIFAFGTILYEMLAGVRAFQKPTSAETMTAILNEEPVPIAQIASQTPPALQRVLHRSLQKDPLQRFQSASDMLFALQALSDSGVLTVTPAGRANFPANRKVRPSTQVGIVFAVLVLAAITFISFHRTPKLTAKDTIVLADFDNKTGDIIFDDTLKTALSVSLRQSPFLNVLSDGDVAKTLRLMTRPVNTKLAPEVAREVCIRAGSKAYLKGSISTLGSEYVLGLQAVNCQSGETLGEKQTTAASKEKVLDALGTAASELRSELGESLGNVKKFDVPLSQATTYSLEALKAESLGIKTLREKGSAAALPFFQHAVELDPNFASGYVSLGKMYSNAGLAERAKESFTKAYSLRDHASEREKFDIESMYYRHAVGDLENTTRVFREWLGSYPRDPAALGNLAGAYVAQGRYEEALEFNREAVRQSSNDVIGYINLAWTLMALNRFQESRDTIQEALSRKLDAEHLHYMLFSLDFLAGDERGMAEQVAWSEDRPEIIPRFFANQASVEMYFGRVQSSRRSIQRATESGKRTGQREIASFWHLREALGEAVMGNLPEAQRTADTVLSQSTQAKDEDSMGALILAWTGDAVRAKSVLDSLGARFPYDTLVQGVVLPTVQAKIELVHENPERAVETLQTALPYELTARILDGCIYPAYVRGEAYLAIHQGTAAAVEFQKILDHRGIVGACETGALAHLGLARANALLAGTSRGANAVAARAHALKAYEDFLTLWKDADPDIPIYKQAKAEYAKLQ